MTSDCLGEQALTRTPVTVMLLNRF